MREFLVADGNAVDLHAFVKPRYERGDIEPRLISGELQRVGEHGAGGTLTVRARDVDKFQPLLRISHAIQQFARPFQTKPASAPGDVVNVVERV
ncbi:hypothetical protein SDC9_168738 [bioreactor metagenome]|uniref:Uncharacterized protein n=1 Tax=bioreactor metagenome TaxID=1076179 RepID=A0A645G6C9_9ZZZZ